MDDYGDDYGGRWDRDSFLLAAPLQAVVTTDFIS